MRMALLIVIAGFGIAHGASDLDPVTVRLRDTAAVPARGFTVGDVADVSGGLPRLRDQIAKLDLVELPADKATATLPRRQVEMRVALAGVAAGAYRVAGPEACQVNLKTTPIRPDEVVAAAKQALHERLPWKADEVLIDLVQPVVAVLPAVARDEKWTIKAEPRTGQPTVGRVQMDVTLQVNGHHRLSLPVYLEVRPYQQTVVCLRRVEKGEPLTDKNTYLEGQPVDHRSKLALSPAVRTGAVARHPISPGQVVLITDIEQPGTKAGGAVIHAQEAVKIQVQVGGLRVTTTGQALQEGKQDQLIRVQNVDSKKVVVGRVVGPGIVEVE